MSRDYTHLVDELRELVDYIRETRRELGTVHRDLPSAFDALGMVSKTTEKATHNLLGLVEALVDEDDASREALEVIAQNDALAAEPGVRAAVKSLENALVERGDKLTAMMSELSFQDLTCQTIDKIAGTIVEVERRVVALLDDGKAPASVDRPVMAGIDRLVESQEGDGRQAMVDEILSNR